VVQNTGIKYSVLLEQYFAPFEGKFKGMEFMDEIIDFAVTAWKFGNLKVLLPKNEFESTNDILKNQDVNVPLLFKMIDHKVEHFKEHTNFITDFELEETEADPILRVYTQTEEAYFSKLSNKIED
jgi:hypothetical protein